MYVEADTYTHGHAWMRLLTHAHNVHNPTFNRRLQNQSAVKNEIACIITIKASCEYFLGG